MLVTVQLPRPLWNLADKHTTEQLDAETVGAALKQLIAHYPGLRPHLETDDGQLRDSVEVELNGADVASHLDLLTPVQDGDVILIVPVLKGGGLTRR